MANQSSTQEGLQRGHGGSGQPARPGSFLAQVLAELRKVVRPTREELVTYTLVVLVFVATIMAFVFGLDQVFMRVVGLVFGN